MTLGMIEELSEMEARKMMDTNFFLEPFGSARR